MRGAKTILLSLVILFCSIEVFAQDQDTVEHESADDVAAPMILKYVEAQYPPEDLAQGREAEVVAQLGIDEQGAVTDVTIVESAGVGFDEAATSAMGQFKFKPALRGGSPIAARVVFRYRFVLDGSDTEVEDVPPAGTDKKEMPPEIETNPPGDDEPEFSYETIVHGAQSQSFVSRRKLEADEIDRIPGAHGDALRAIQNLPGVARMPLMAGAFVVRGSEPKDSVYFVDGMGSPTIYHFGGVSSIINTDLLEEVVFYPGNFPVRYGRAIGGAVEVKTRAPSVEGLHAYVDVDLWDATVLAEMPLSRCWSFAASARRSYIDFFVDNIDLDTGPSFSVMPRYYDFQFVADYHPDENDNLRIVLYGSDDKVRFDEDWEWGDYDILGALPVHSYVYRVQANWFRQFGKGVTNKLDLGVGFWGGEEERSLMDISWQAFPIHLREELSLTPSKYLSLKFGTDNGLTWRETSTKVDMPGGEISGDLVEEKKSQFDFYPAIYTDLEFTPIENLRLIPGVRVDYYSTVEKWSFDPRFIARYRPLELTVFKTGVGIFHQPPSMYEIEPEDTGLKPQVASAVHYSIGVEQRIPGYERLKIDLEGFYKDLNGQYSFAERAVGLELLIRIDPDSRFFGWLAYTFMNSEYHPPSVDSFIPTEFDQTHILSVVGSVHLGWNIDAGFRFRLATGLPYTPVVGAQSYGYGTYIPDYGPQNSARNKLFHQLDLRVDKKWQGDKLSFSVYLDIQNIYARKNVLFYMYNEDYTQKKGATDIPFFPSLGLRLEY